MSDLEISLKFQGIEFSKILALKRANMLTEENIARYLKSDEAKTVARALMKGNVGNLPDRTSELVYAAVDKLA